MHMYSREWYSLVVPFQPSPLWCLLWCAVQSWGWLSTILWILCAPDVLFKGQGGQRDGVRLWNWGKQQTTYSAVKSLSGICSTSRMMLCVSNAWMLHIACIVQQKCQPWCTSGSALELMTVDQNDIVIVVHERGHTLSFADQALGHWCASH